MTLKISLSSKTIDLVLEQMAQVTEMTCNPGLSIRAHTEAQYEGAHTASDKLRINLTSAPLKIFTTIMCKKSSHLQSMIQMGARRTVIRLQNCCQFNQKGEFGGVF